ncbi:MAG: Rrf2 family transcriptional regulator [Syntrophales bacterium]
MRLSCRGRYAIRAMIELALHYSSKEMLSLKTIEENQGISRKYLIQLMSSLRVAGLVVVLRGKKGGYTLARQASEITLADILFSVEGDMSLVDCVKNPRLCKRSEKCMAIPTWVELSEIIRNYLKSTTLEDVLIKMASPKVTAQSEIR